MGALPKRKSSKARRDKRRSMDKLLKPQLSTEKVSKKATLPHRVSPFSGIYRGKKVLEVK